MVLISRVSEGPCFADQFGPVGSLVINTHTPLVGLPVDQSPRIIAAIFFQGHRDRGHISGFLKTVGVAVWIVARLPDHGLKAFFSVQGKVSRPGKGDGATEHRAIAWHR